MAKHGIGQKLRIVYLYKILFEHTDIDHPKTRSELCDILNDGYDMQVERKTFYDDLELLRSMGADIVKGEKRGSYFLGQREFEMPELHLLADAIESSQFITEKKSRELIGKLTTLCSKYEGQSLKQKVTLASRNKTLNESIFRNIDTVYDAISKGKQLSFHYFNWSLCDGKLTKAFRHNGERYRVSPWFVAWNDEKYYLIAYDNSAEKLKHYRIDKMESPAVETEARLGAHVIESLDIATYTEKHFNMYNGEERQITLRFSNELLGVAVDRFGKNSGLRPDDENHFLMITKVVVSPQFYGFLYSLEDGVELIAPADVREEMKQSILKLKEIYGD